MTDSSSIGNEPDTEYEPGQDNVQILGLDVHNPVFAVSALTIIAFVFFSLVFQDQASEFFGWLRPALTSQFDWVFMIACNIFVLFSLFLVVSPYGSIRLGGDSARPDYSYAGWFSMLFAAGMGIGLVFWGVAEPISHYGSSLGGTSLGENGLRSDWAPLGAAAGNAEGAREMAMAATIFHWGLHPWAIYAVVALALAFFSFNHGLPLTMRSVFYPIFGKATWGPLGHIIDVLAVFATIFGLATSLGLGATQALAGLNYLFDVPVSDGMKVVSDHRHHGLRAGLGCRGARQRRQAPVRSEYGPGRSAVGAGHHCWANPGNPERLFHQSGGLRCLSAGTVQLDWS